MTSTITIKPDPLSFGCICEGFIYKLRVYLYNHGKSIDRFRVVLSPDSDTDINTMKTDYKLSNLAPGVGTPFTLELRAAVTCQTSYTMVVTKASTKMSEAFAISATIIPRDTFKKVAKSLMLREKGIYAPGVKCLGQLAGDISGPSVVSGAPTIYSEALIDDEELEELVDIPVLRQTYWDPYRKKLCVDEILCQVMTDPKWSVDQSQAETQKRCDDRMDDLEAQGMLTSRILERLLNEKANRSVTMPQSMSLPEMFSILPSQHQASVASTT